MPPATKISTRLLLFRRLLRLLLFLLLFLLPSWLCYKFWNGPHMRVWNLEVEGENRLSPLAVHHLSDLHYGLHFTDLDEEEAKRRLEKHPWIQEAKVEWDFPSTVRVEIVEETTHALLAMEKMWYVNENGIPFRVASPLDLDYPIISGIPNSWAKKHPHVVKKIIDESLHILQVCTQTPYISKQKVSEVYFQKNAGFTIILRNGSKIIFGFYPPEDRIERLTQMIESGLELSSPKQIVLDAEKVAVVMPLN